jgi:hypothetical protein
MTQALTIGAAEIHQIDGLYSLNDFHTASGENRKHQPANFLRLDTSKALAEEIKSSDVRISPIKVIRGAAGGTYVCRELVIAYAAWISPAFHLKVIRVFLDREIAPKPAERVAHPEPDSKVWPAQVEMAHSAAMHVAINIADYIFKAELSEKDWVNQRFVFGFDDPKTGRCWCKPLPSGALTVSVARLAEIIGNPDYLADDAELIRLAAACCQRIAQRIPEHRDASPVRK